MTNMWNKNSKQSETYCYLDFKMELSKTVRKNLQKLKIVK